MARKEVAKPITVNYGDYYSHLLLWQKALLIVPLWAIAVIPLIGFAAHQAGHWCMQLVFGALLASFCMYFLQDMLKRKIKIDDDFIFFGFRAVPISSLISVDVTYKKGRFLPVELVLISQSGNKLKFALSRLSENAVESLLKQLHARNSDLHAATVLNSLVKCRSIESKLSHTSDTLVLSYQSRQFITQSVDSFVSTAKKWARVGPVIAFALALPAWIAFLNNLYLWLVPSSVNNSPLYLYRFLLVSAETFWRWWTSATQQVGEAVGDVGNNTGLVAVAVASIMVFVGILVQQLLRPNCIRLTTNSLSLATRFGEFLLPARVMQLQQISSVVLFKHKHGDHIRITNNKGKALDLKLASITPSDRQTLLRRLEKSVPGLIDPEVSRSMLPGSERSYTEIWLRSLTDSPERKTLDPLEPGQLVGDNRFEVLRSIGVGGQGKAYLCRVLDHCGSEPETVVLKETIVPVFSDGAVRKRALESFEKEARLLMDLKDESIVKLLDYFIEDHRAYLVLEHIDGCSLRETVKLQGALGVRQVFSLALQMCNMLTYLHSRSTVHRDFTPDNLILNSRGTLKLIDFNVAQNLQNGFSGTIVGKHAYLPPEQFRGQATTQSDLYAFGSTLYYLLTGTDPEPISQSSPSTRNPEVSKALNEIVKRSTALQTNNRYRTAAEIESDLVAAQEAEYSTWTVQQGAGT